MIDSFECENMVHTYHEEKINQKFQERKGEKTVSKGYGPKLFPLYSLLLSIKNRKIHFTES